MAGIPPCNSRKDATRDGEDMSELKWMGSGRESSSADVSK
jgi:hypothetical protein